MANAPEKPSKWAILQDMGPKEINKILKRQKQEIDLYSEKIELSTNIISVLVSRLNGVRSRRKAALETPPVRMVDQGTSTEPKISRKALQQEVEKLRAVLWEKDQEIKSKNAEINELSVRCDDQKQKIKELTTVGTGVRENMEALIKQVETLSSLVTEEPTVDISVEDVTKARENMEK